MLLNDRLKTIVGILKDKNDYMTSSQLAQQMNISVRTMKSALKILKSEVEPYGAYLEIKRGVGYRLHITDEKAFLPIANRIQDRSFQQFPNTHKERSIYIIRKLLSIDYPIKLEDLADELYVCRNTISLDMKEVKKLLQNYHLVIKLSNNNGIVVDGSEIQKRNCINDYFFQDTMTDVFVQNNVMLASEYNQNEIRYIKEALLHVLNENHIHFSDVSIQNMVIHIVIQLRRCKFYQYVSLDQTLIDKMKLHQKAYKAAIELKDMLEEQMNIVFPEHEIIYLTMHILSKTVMGSQDIQKINLSYVDQLLSKIFDRLDERFSIDLRKDQEIYQLLKLHIPLMMERIRMQLTMRNPMSVENNRRYQFAVEMTLEAVRMIEDLLHIRIDHNEFGYLVLYFNLALDKYCNRTKNRLILVCGYGRPEMIMMLNALNENFKGFIEDIVTCDVIELEHFVFCNNDIIITTIPVMTRHIPVVYIQGKIEYYYHEILSLLKSEHLVHVSIGLYLKPTVYRDGLLCKNKSAVLNEFYDLLKNVYTHKEASQLIENISDLAQEVGHETVCLHSYYDCQHPFIAFISLRNQILWEKQQVKFIFFLNMNGENNKEIVHDMYQHISNWIELKSRIRYYEKNQNYEELIESLDNS